MTWAKRSAIERSLYRSATGRPGRPSRYTVATGDDRVMIRRANRRIGIATGRMGRSIRMAEGSFFALGRAAHEAKVALEGIPVNRTVTIRTDGAESVVKIAGEVQYSLFWSAANLERRVTDA